MITGVCRFSYVHIAEPSETPSGDLRYSCAILIPKKDKKTVDEVKTLIKAALKAKFGDKKPKGAKIALRDGDAEFEAGDRGEEYKGHYFVNASSKNQPGIVGPTGKPLMDIDDFYSGCYGRADINFFGFDKAGNKGVGCGLDNVMKTADGERLDGRQSAEKAFAGYAEDSDPDSDPDVDLPDDGEVEEVGEDEDDLL